MNNLQFAIKMEYDGEKFYRNQAKLNKDNNLNEVCLMLAEDEKNHAVLLENKMKDLNYELPASSIANEKTIFENLKDLSIEEKEKLSQLDFYILAADMEKQSIKLYRKYLDASPGKRSREIFEYLIKQEQHHFELIDSLAEALRHAEEWIENAEFGNRPEY
ncbi:MAG TPA: ferritin family protein [Clostridia bacterium]|nr:ferritin family protein [Clostridia bacterium]